MNEKFQIIELKQITNKDNKIFYYVVLYSNLEYLINVFVDKEKFDTLKRDFKVIDINQFLRKSYNKEKQAFNYYIDYPKK